MPSDRSTRGESGQLGPGDGLGREVEATSERQADRQRTTGGRSLGATINKSNGKRRFAVPFSSRAWTTNTPQKPGNAPLRGNKMAITFGVVGMRSSETGRFLDSRQRKGTQAMGGKAHGVYRQ
jgi:hypothetical protein